MQKIYVKICNNRGGGQYKITPPPKPGSNDEGVTGFETRRDEFTTKITLFSIITIPIHTFFYTYNKNNNKQPPYRVYKHTPIPYIYIHPPWDIYLRPPGIIPPIPPRSFSRKNSCDSDPLVRVNTLQI
jgi:hypothetical protein